jgi:hypothetical protein
MKDIIVQSEPTKTTQKLNGLAHLALKSEPTTQKVKSFAHENDESQKTSKMSCHWHRAKSLADFGLNGITDIPFSQGPQLRTLNSKLRTPQMTSLVKYPREDE